MLLCVPLFKTYVYRIFSSDFYILVNRLVLPQIVRGLQPNARATKSGEGKQMRRCVSNGFLFHGDFMGLPGYYGFKVTFQSQPRPLRFTHSAWITIAVSGSAPMSQMHSGPTLNLKPSRLAVAMDPGNMGWMDPTRFLIPPAIIVSGFQGLRLAGTHWNFHKAQGLLVAAPKSHLSWRQNRWRQNRTWQQSINFGDCSRTQHAIDWLVIADGDGWPMFNLLFKSPYIIFIHTYVYIYIYTHIWIRMQ